MGIILRSADRKNSMDTKANPQEITALIEAARNGADATGKQTRSFEPCRFERSGRFSTEQKDIANSVQEAFAKGITQSLAAYLRVSFEVVLAPPEQMTFRESLESSTHGMYLMLVQFCGAAAVIRIDQSIVFPLIDILLGGTGQAEIVAREATEIEDHVMEGVGKIICHEIAMAWGVPAGDCNLLGAQGLGQMQRLLPANDRVVVSQFKIKMAEVGGQMQVLIPEMSFNSLVRKLSNNSAQGKIAKPAPSDGKLSEKLLECSFSAALAITAIQLPVDRLLQLGPSQVCDLGIPVSRPAALVIAGREVFEATPVRQGRKRAAQIGQQKTFSTTKRTAQ
jgi:flagellar motor switch protein FliM